MAPDPLPHEWWHRRARTSPGTSKVPGLPFEPSMQPGGRGVRPSTANLIPFPRQEPGPLGASSSSHIYQPVFVSAPLPHSRASFSLQGAHVLCAPTESGSMTPLIM